MDDTHYGLTGRPFALTPDPRFWFDTATHRKAMAYLGYGLAQGEGFIVVTGEIGAGKTTLLGHLLATIDRERLHVIKIVSSQLGPDDLLRVVATGLDIETADLVKAQLLVAIERGLHAQARAGKRTLLVVDEAQALAVGALEELRMLSNFQAGGHALVQIFLLGQPEFRAALHGSERLEQLRQRVIATHHLDPMEAGEVGPYIEHRLRLVGWQGRPRFTTDAYQALYYFSDGVPRRLNQLASRVMLFGSIDNLTEFDGDVVAAAAADLAGDLPGTREPARPAPPTAQPVEPRPAPVAATMSPPVIAPNVEPDVAEPVWPVEQPKAEPVTDAPVPLPASPRREEPRPEPTPLPIAHMPVPDAPRPIRMVEPAPVVVEPKVAPEPLAVAPSAPEPVIEPRREQTAGDGEFDHRFALMEARLEEQDVALRRVLTLLVDWIESDGHGEARHRAA